MAVFEIKQSTLMSFAAPEKPFLAFDQFCNIVQYYRDVHYAPNFIRNFQTDIGRRYNLWTAELSAYYKRNLIFDDLIQEIKISTSLGNVTKNSTFPICFELFDQDGLYFSLVQQIAVERFIEGRFHLTSWRKVDTICEFVLQEQNPIQTAA